ATGCWGADVMAAWRAAERPRRYAMPSASSTRTTDVTIATGSSEGGCNSPTWTVEDQVMPSSINEVPTILQEPDGMSLDTAPGALLVTRIDRRSSEHTHTARERGAGAIDDNAPSICSLVTVNVCASSGRVIGTAADDAFAISVLAAWGAPGCPFGNTDRATAEVAVSRASCETPVASSCTCGPD